MFGRRVFALWQLPDPCYVIRVNNNRSFFFGFRLFSSQIAIKGRRKIAIRRVVCVSLALSLSLSAEWIINASISPVRRRLIWSHPHDRLGTRNGYVNGFISHPRVLVDCRYVISPFRWRTSSLRACSSSLSRRRTHFLLLSLFFFPQVCRVTSRISIGTCLDSSSIMKACCKRGT